MILLNASELSKSYTEKPLLSRLSLSIHQGEKIGLIGINGAGKSTLLRILAGQEEPEEGFVTLTGGVQVGYLPQNPSLKEETVLGQVLADTAADGVPEYQCKNILTRLGVSDFDQPVAQLSGGQKKRVALASALARPVDLLILDEPTNHLDSFMVEWLEQYLCRYKGALLMITHDRYFLDRVANRIIELENGSLFRYDGNYSYYLEGKAARQESALAEERKRRTLYKKELAWIRRGVMARGTKSKSRKDRFEELKRSALASDPGQAQIESAGSRLGRKIIEISHVSKAYGNQILIRDFDYILLRNDRVGIVGPNGSGKTTLLKIIQGFIPPDSGQVEIGDTVKIGYFSQDHAEMDPGQRIIDYVQETAFHVTTKEGVLSASQMLERFLFPPSTHSIQIGRLSGGEKRRLYLLRILMEAPNVLLFDEPTNDLDTVTLAVLEDYLDSFPGAVVTVSHDRYFLDRLCTRIFAFSENGAIGHYPGGYSDYMEYKKQEEEQREAAGKKTAPPASPANGGKSGKAQRAEPSGEQDGKQKRLKFSYNEQREFETIDQDIADLEEALRSVEHQMTMQTSDYDSLSALLTEKEKLSVALAEKMDRWVYLNDLAEQM